MGTLKPLTPSAGQELCLNKLTCTSSIHTNYSMIQGKSYLFSWSIFLLSSAKTPNIGKVIYSHLSKCWLLQLCVLCGRTNR